MAERITESDLILPSLYIMNKQGGSCSTSQLQKPLRDMLELSEEDREILSGRGDDKFSQIVRNLKAHNTFEREGYAEYDNRKFHITDKGREYLMANMEYIEYLVSGKFGKAAITDSLVGMRGKGKKRVIIYDENAIANEGDKNSAQAARYSRSAELRDYAISQFTVDGKISCRCCGFNFDDHYGELGKGYIEIHHIKPISRFENEDKQKTFKEALENLIPICANCHKIVHRNWRSPLDIELLCETINASRN